MKKIILLTVTVLFLLSLFSCSVSQRKIVGIWTTEIDGNYREVLVLNSDKTFEWEQYCGEALAGTAIGSYELEPTVLNSEFTHIVKFTDTERNRSFSLQIFLNANEESIVLSGEKATIYYLFIEPVVEEEPEETPEESDDEAVEEEVAE